MLLSDLTAVPRTTQIVGPSDPEITGLSYDTRTLEPGDLFFAVPGFHVDGHRFIGTAVAAGAAAVVVQDPVEGDPMPPIPYVVVPDVRSAMADLAARFYDDPAEKLTLIGVTGTDGKTTTSTLVHALLQATAHTAGLATTVSYRIGDHEWSNLSRQTTPESIDIQRLLASMVAAGATHAVVETSSHALALGKMRGCRFDAAIFTNLTSDHLDFHGTIEEYRAAKLLLFSGLGPDSKNGARPVAILNRDDPSYDAFRAAAHHASVVSYGMNEHADLRAYDIHVAADGMRFRVTAPDHPHAIEVESPLTGRFNVYNLLAALAYASTTGIDLGVAARALSDVKGVTGRMRRVDAGQPFTVIVDYAHTPDSLAKVLDELRAVTAGRLIAVFGARGEGDKGKRPVMGRIAAERCDIVILTDEDPYLEDRLAIIDEIAAGARLAGAREHETLLRHPDRREAIAAAMRLARPGDTVLLAGKGHESCIVVGTERRPWNEEAEARAALAATGAVGA